MDGLPVIRWKHIHSLIIQHISYASFLCSSSVEVYSKACTCYSPIDVVHVRSSFRSMNWADSIRAHIIVIIDFTSIHNWRFHSHHLIKTMIALIFFCCCCNSYLLLIRLMCSLSSAFIVLRKPTPVCTTDLSIGIRSIARKGTFSSWNDFAVAILSRNHFILAIFIPYLFCQKSVESSFQLCQALQLVQKRQAIITICAIHETIFLYK